MSVRDFTPSITNLQQKHPTTTTLEIKRHLDSKETLTTT